MTFTQEEIQQMLQKQAMITCREIALFCVDICDKNRGNLSVGDLIKKHFGLENETYSEVKKSIKDKKPRTKHKPILKVIK